MSGYFAPGDRVFLTAGIEVLEARVDRAQYGRYVISYKGSGYESEGRICVSGNRLYRSYDDAAAHITRLADVSSIKKARPQTSRAYRQQERIDPSTAIWAPAVLCESCGSGPVMRGGSVLIDGYKAPVMTD